MCLIRDKFNHGFYFTHGNEDNTKHGKRRMFWAFSEGALAFTSEGGGRDTREIQVNRKPKGKGENVNMKGRIFHKWGGWRGRTYNVDGDSKAD